MTPCSTVDSDFHAVLGEGGVLARQEAICAQLPPSCP